MPKWMPTTSLALCALLGACQPRWEPESTGPVQFTSACPMKRAPEVTEFGTGGVRAVYHFVTQDAPRSDLEQFVGNTGKHKFNLVLMTVNINGKDTLFAQGPGVLRNQHQIDAEFELACSMGTGAIYVTHVRYDEPQQGNVRVR